MITPMRKSILISSILVALAAGYFYGLPYFQQQTAKKPVAAIKKQDFKEGESSTSQLKLLVQLTKSGFQPSTITAKPGQRIQFYNGSGAKMKLVRDDGSKTGFDGTVVAVGTYYHVAFSQPGTVTFHNELNPSQKGTITVK